MRPVWRSGGWVNRIGLRNPGLPSIRRFRPDAIYSLAAITPADWAAMAALVPDGANVEVNLGCPNGGEHAIAPDILADLARRCAWLSVKLPPQPEALAVAEQAVACGVAALHLCNTLPTARGGESGPRLRAAALPLVREARRRFGPRLRIIGGGGIYAPDDVAAYREAGADHFSLATIWFTPWRALALLREAA